MTSPKDIPQPNPGEGISNDVSQPRVRRTRPRRVHEIYPTNPIVIPPERREQAREALVATDALWNEGKHYDALTTWFNYPIWVRGDAVSAVLLDEANTERSLQSAQYDTVDQPEHFVLKHYSLLTIPSVKKIILPSENTPITRADVRSIRADSGESQHFRKNLDRLGLGHEPHYEFLDDDDFIEPNQDILRSFTLEDAREFLVRLVPHLNDEEVRRNLLSSWGVVYGVKWADLLTDPRLTDALEHPILR